MTQIPQDVIDAAKIEPSAPEQKIIDDIIKLLSQKLRDDYKGLTFLRDTHPKSDGLVWGEFVVDPDIPEEYQVGIFKTPGKTYKTWMRFSNSAPQVTVDSERDFRGLSLKLFGVEGEKLLDDEKYTQDFLLLGFDSFFAANPQDFFDFFNVLVNGKLTKTFGETIGSFFSYFLTRGSFKQLTSTLRGRQVFANPIEAHWFSVAPYLFGDESKVVKYLVRPSAGFKQDSPIPSDFKKRDDYLRAAISKTLTEEYSLDFLIQFRTNPEIQDVEDVAVAWSSEISPFIKIATIKIPPQEIDSPEQRAFDENLTFNPWHSIAEHQPIGEINRARKQVMRAIQKIRLAENGVTHVEPTGDERF